MDIGYLRAIELLKEVATPFGFLASKSGIDNYARIWTRDGVICGLAALASQDEGLIACFEQTLITIFKNQHESGFFPSNVAPEKSEVSYGGTVGRTDNPSWAVIGLCSFLKHQKESKLKDLCKKNVSKAFALMDAWEFNGRHLIYVPQSGDWADEYFHHGYILFDQLLRVWALELASQIYAEPKWQEKARTIRKVIEQNFHGDGIGEETYLPLLQREKNKFPNSYWILGFNPGEVYFRFDLQANALALYLGVGGEARCKKIVQFLESVALSEMKLLPSFHPEVNESDKEMAMLKNNFAYRFRNKSGEFHNSGLWPVWNGFLLACVQKYKAHGLEDTLLSALELYCQKPVNRNEWVFNECMSAHTLEPCGVDYCSWSAAGFVLARKGFYET